MSEVLDGRPVAPMSGSNVIGEVTENLQRFLLDGWDISERPPRMEEDLSFVPKDREEVIYIYMYRLAHNPNLQNSRRYRQAPVFLNSEPDEGGEVYFHRPPLMLDLFYLIMVHSKFRSDAERLLGWVLLRLNEATHLVHRPRKFILPDGREVDSLGRPYARDARDADDLLMEKVSLALVDDLTVGDATNLFSLHEAPYRPFLTYRARVVLHGSLLASGGGTQINLPRLENTASNPERRRPPAAGQANGRRESRRMGLPGPKPHFVRRMTDAAPDTDMED
ncbi:MAG: Pvc16 family protein [Myxococcota bacterium]